MVGIRSERRYTFVWSVTFHEDNFPQIDIFACRHFCTIAFKLIFLFCLTFVFFFILNSFVCFLISLLPLTLGRYFISFLIILFLLSLLPLTLILGRYFFLIVYLIFYYHYYPLPLVGKAFPTAGFLIGGWWL